MVVFELTMPNCNTWNGTWSGAGRRYIKTKPDRKVPKDKIDRDFFTTSEMDGLRTYMFPVCQQQKQENSKRSLLDLWGMVG